MNGLTPRRATSLSYKFQRLREKIRHAVLMGELAGKLPGERELSKRFGVNAKTLSKALTDLAAEGVLYRSIGRGTFVKGSEPAESGSGRWLLLAEGSDENDAVVRALQQLNPGCQIADAAQAARPSFLNQFEAVIDLSPSTPDAFLRSLMVRNVPAVLVGKSARPYSINAVLPDMAFAAVWISRHLILLGHRNFVTVASSLQATLIEELQRVAARFGETITITPAAAKDVPQRVAAGATAVLCGCVDTADEVIETLRAANISVPRQVSVAAVGWQKNAAPCTGQFIRPEQAAEGVAEILQNGNNSNPTVLWVAGEFVNAGTTAPPSRP